MRIGYWAGDIGPYAVHPSYTRAVMEAKEILEQQAGHELVEFPLPDATQLAKHYSGYIYRYRRLQLKGAIIEFHAHHRYVDLKQSSCNLNQISAHLVFSSF